MLFEAGQESEVAVEDADDVVRVENEVVEEVELVRMEMAEVVAMLEDKMVGDKTVEAEALEAEVLENEEVEGDWEVEKDWEVEVPNVVELEVEETEGEIVMILFVEMAEEDDSDMLVTLDEEDEAVVETTLLLPNPTEVDAATTDDDVPVKLYISRRFPAPQYSTELPKTPSAIDSTHVF